MFVDYCAACGLGTAPWDVATGSGATLAREGNVGGISDPAAASFLSAEVGYVAGDYLSSSASGAGKSQQRIVGTTDGGRTWHVEYASAPRNIS